MRRRAVSKEKVRAEGAKRAPRKNRFITQITHLMYAIVEINGHQFKVEQGRKLFVDRVRNAESGQTVEFDKVLLMTPTAQ